MYSSVFGRTVRGADLTAAYWAAKLRRPVRFADACAATMEDAERTLYVELGAPPPLIASLDENTQSAPDAHTSVPTLRRGTSERESLLTSLGEARSRGCDPKWDRVLAAGEPRPGR